MWLTHLVKHIGANYHKMKVEIKVVPELYHSSLHIKTCGGMGVKLHAFMSASRSGHFTWGKEAAIHTE